MTPKQLGNLTELKCISSFYENGYRVSIPYGENSRYDFIGDINGKLIRVQVKTSHEIEPGVFAFSCRSTYVNRQNTHSKKYSENDIDYFATYYNNICYLVPVADCGTQKILRINDPKNNQEKNIHYAAEYEITNQINKILDK